MTSTSYSGLVLYNPHVDDFLAAPPHFKILGRRPLRKYGFLLDGLRRRGDRLPVIVDGTASCFVPGRIFATLPQAIRKRIAAEEFRAWLRINSIEPHEVALLGDKDDLSNLTVFCFSYKAATDGFALRESTLTSCRRVVMHLSHYFLWTAQKAANLQKLPNLILAGDSDIRANAYFRSTFSWYAQSFLVLPFAVAPRFKVGEPISDRSPECVATGTFHCLEYEEPRASCSDFMAITRFNTFHPIRRAIFERKHALKGTVHSLISPYRKYAHGSRLINLAKHFQVSQKKYFSIDIAKTYGQYIFAVVGEEGGGFPALGALEAMACGAVLIAQPQYYTGLELKPDVHFLPYDGTVDGLVRVISAPPGITELAELSARAASFVASHFSPEAAFSSWMRSLGAIMDHQS